MATDKKGVIVYADWMDKFEVLEDDEAGRLIKHFFRYVNDLAPEAPDRITEISFIDIEKSLKRDLKKWETTLEGRSKAGIASAEARRLKKLSEQNPSNSTSVKSVGKNPSNTTVNVNDNVNVSVKVNVNDINKRKEDFKKSLTPFLDAYSKSLLNEFYSYWAEHGLKDKKMRFEKQKSFGIERRLSTWAKNNEKWASESGDISFSEKVLGKEKANSVLEMLKKNDIDNEQNLIK